MRPKTTPQHRALTAVPPEASPEELLLKMPRYNTYPENILLEMFICLMTSPHGIRKAGYDLFYHKRLASITATFNQTFPNSTRLLPITHRGISEYARLAMRAPVYNNKTFTLGFNNGKTMEPSQVAFAYPAWLVSVYLNWRLDYFGKLGGLKYFFFLEDNTSDHTTPESHSELVDEELLNVKSFLSAHSTSYVELKDFYIKKVKQSTEGVLSARAFLNNLEENLENMIKFQKRVQDHLGAHVPSPDHVLETQSITDIIENERKRRRRSDPPCEAGDTSATQPAQHVEPVSSRRRDSEVFTLDELKVVQRFFKFAATAPLNQFMTCVSSTTIESANQVQPSSSAVNTTVEINEDTRTTLEYDPPYSIAPPPSFLIRNILSPVSNSKFVAF